jgi:hypothetical protein
VLLLTTNALESGWVSREIDFARGKGIGRSNSHLLILKAEDVAVPEAARSVGKVVDCDRIWWSRGISEELFGAIYGREGRRAWLSHESGDRVSEGDTLRYGDLGTDAGTVVAFDWTSSPCSDSDFRRRDLSWCLEYRRRSGERVRVAGGGEEKPADLDMRLGDRIAFVKLRRRWGNDLGTGLPLWMRSDDLNVSPDAVLDRYFGALEVNDDFRPAKGRMHKRGVDALGRVIADVHLQGRHGEWRRLEAPEWAMLKKDVDSEQVLHRLTSVELGWA